MDWNMEHGVELHLRLEQDLLSLRDGRMMLVLLLQLLLLLWLSLLLLRLLLLLLWQTPPEFNDLNPSVHNWVHSPSVHTSNYECACPSLNTYAKV